MYYIKTDGARMVDSKPATGECPPGWVTVSDETYAVLSKRNAELDLMGARSIMAAEFGKLPDNVRAYHLADYEACQSAMDRGDVAAAKKRIETMEVCPDVENPEALRAHFLSFFPTTL